jgi:ribosomal protein S8
MKENKTYTQNEKNFTNNLNFLFKRKNKRRKTYQALREKFEVYHSKTNVKKLAGTGGIIVQQNQGIKQQAR